MKIMVHDIIYNDNIDMCQKKASSCSTGWPPRRPRRRIQQPQLSPRFFAPPPDLASATAVDNINGGAGQNANFQTTTIFHKTIPASTHIIRPVLGMLVFKSCDIVINTANATFVSFDWWKYTKCFSSRNTDLTKSGLLDQRRTCLHYKTEQDLGDWEVGLGILV